MNSLAKYFVFLLSQQVSNPFKDGGVFKIIVNEPKINPAPPPPPDKKGSKRSKEKLQKAMGQGSKRNSTRPKEEPARPQSDISSFYSQHDTVEMEAGGKETISVSLIIVELW